MTSAPELTTARLTLRAHTIHDFEPYAAFFASDRAEHIGRLDRRKAWYAFCSDVAQWALHGYGAWAITDDTNSFVGQVGILKPDEFPEPELGWLLLKDQESKGIATEAAIAARDWAFVKRGLPTLVSYIAPANIRSQKLAERLGACVDTTAVGDDPDDMVYRHPNSKDRLI